MMRAVAYIHSGPPDWRGSSRLPTSPSSSLSWLPQTPSAPPRSSPPSPSTIPTTTPSSSTNPLPSFTQQDLDVLVEGIDFDDGFETEFLQDDLKASGPPAASPLPASASPKKVLPEHELDELVSGIDFSQDLQIDSDEGGDIPRTESRALSPALASTSKSAPIAPTAPRPGAARSLPTAAPSDGSETSSPLEVSAVRGRDGSLPPSDARGGRVLLRAGSLSQQPDLRDPY